LIGEKYRYSLPIRPGEEPSVQPKFTESLESSFGSSETRLEVKRNERFVRQDRRDPPLGSHDHLLGVVHGPEKKNEPKGKR